MHACKHQYNQLPELTVSYKSVILTRGIILQILIANIWGEREQLDETVSTLRFATRMMCVASEPAINEQVDPTVCFRALSLS